MRCALCNADITQAEFAKARTARIELFLPAMRTEGAFPEWFKQYFSDFDFSRASRSLPLSVCLAHIKACRYGKSASLDPLVEPAQSRLSLSPAAAILAAHCEGSRCWICSTKSVRVASSSCPAEDEGSDDKSIEPAVRSGRTADGTRRPAPSADISTFDFHRSRWAHDDVRLLRHRSVSALPSLTTSDVVTLGHSMSTSTRKAAVGARHLESIGAVRSPSTSLIRRDSTRRNKLFRMFFRSTPVSALFSPHDAALHSCHALVDFVRCIIWIRQKTPSDVALFRFSADSGQGDLKISFQLIYSDDSVFSAATRSDRSAGGDEFLDASVKRTFICALMNGAKETYDSLSLMFDSLDLAGVKSLLRNAEFVFPVDMKLANIVLGLGPVGCAFPYAYTLWSPFKKHSQPHVRRTVPSIARDDADRSAAEGDSKESGAELLQRFHSVYHRPMNFVALFVGEHLSDFIVPPQLHILLGLVKDLYDAVNIFSKDVTAQWLAKIGVHHDDRHGRSGFIGNDCRKMLASASVLESLLTRATRSSGEEMRHISTVVDALRCLDKVVAAVMSVSLGTTWAEAIANSASHTPLSPKHSMQQSRTRRIAAKSA